jgi:hypothetical protein
MRESLGAACKQRKDATSNFFCAARTNLCGKHTVLVRKSRSLEKAHRATQLARPGIRFASAPCRCLASQCVPASFASPYVSCRLLALPRHALPLLCLHPAASTHFHFLSFIRPTSGPNPEPTNYTACVCVCVYVAANKQIKLHPNFLQLQKKAPLATELCCCRRWLLYNAATKV